MAELQTRVRKFFVLGITYDPPAADDHSLEPSLTALTRFRQGSTRDLWVSPELLDPRPKSWSVGRAYLGRLLLLATCRRLRHLRTFSHRPRHVWASSQTRRIQNQRPTDL